MYSYSSSSSSSSVPRTELRPTEERVPSWEEEVPRVEKRVEVCGEYHGNRQKGLKEGLKKNNREGCDQRK